MSRVWSHRHRNRRDRKDVNGRRRYPAGRNGDGSARIEGVWRPFKCNIYPISRLCRRTAKLVPAIVHKYRRSNLIQMVGTLSSCLRSMLLIRSARQTSSAALSRVRLRGVPSCCCDCGSDTLCIMTSTVTQPFLILKKIEKCQIPHRHQSHIVPSLRRPSRSPPA